MRRVSVLDGIAVGLLLAGGLCVATRLLPVAVAGTTLRRVLPLLLFLGTVIVLAELTAAAKVFDVLAVRLARLARGRYAALFGLCVLLAAVTTAVLNLDTTAVLLTPVMLALARSLELDPLPLAMTTAWLANTASLLLPVSNLTNLLAADRVGLGPLAYAGRMWLPEVGAVAATAAVLWVCWWRGARGTYAVPERTPERRRSTYLAASAACALFLGGILLGVPIGTASSVCAAITVGAFAVADRGQLAWSLVPWRLLVFVSGLFLIMETVSRHGLTTLIGHLVGTAGGTTGSVRAAGTGAVLANAVNNLPAYLAGEPAIGGQHHTQLLALLIGTNVAPVIAPWASLATLLWYERCRANGVHVPLAKFVLTGTATAILALAAATAGLLVTGG